MLIFCALLANSKGNAMRTARQIKDAIGELRDELDAIIAVSEREERDLTEDESARVTEITDALIPHLNKQLKTASNIEKERLQRAEKRFEDEINASQAAAGTLDTQANLIGHAVRGAIKIPAKAKVYGELKAFKGPDAERDAYIAGNVILAGLYNNDSAKQFCRNHGLQVQNTLGTTTNTGGGFLVPDEMARTIIRLREERGVFPRFANPWPMGSDITTIPRLLSDVTAYWVAEAAEISASDPTIGSAELMARKIAGLCKLSREIDEDAVIQIGDMVTASIAYAIADKIDEAAFNGDGTSTYGHVLGLKNAIHASATSTAITGNDAANNLDIGDFEAAIGMFPAYTGASPRWFMHRAFFYASAGRLVDAAGGNTTQTLAQGVNETMFLGYPVTFTQVLLSTTTTSSSAVYGFFGDLRLGCTYGTRRAMRTEVSLDRYFENDLMGIKVTERVGILCHERGDTIRTRPIIMLKLAA